MESIQLSTRYYRMYPEEEHLGYAHKELVLDKSQTVFLVVDVYGHYDPENKQGTWGNTGSYGEMWAAAIPRIRTTTDAARVAGLPVVYISNSAPRCALENSAYWEKKWDSLHVDKNQLFAEPGVDPWEYHDGDGEVLSYNELVQPKDGDYYIRKHVHSGFFDTRLDTLLRNLDCKTLIFVGFALDMCLGTTMIDALWRNYRVVLLRDCTGAIELNGVDTEGSWTKRWILYTEYAIGSTSTADDWIAACRQITK